MIQVNSFGLHSLINKESKSLIRKEKPRRISYDFMPSGLKFNPSNKFREAFSRIYVRGKCNASSFHSEANYGLKHLRTWRLMSIFLLTCHHPHWISNNAVLKDSLKARTDLVLKSPQWHTFKVNDHVKVIKH